VSSPRMMQWRFSRSWNYHSSDFFRTLVSMRVLTRWNGPHA
jgi:hypothetical protein